MTNKRLPLKVKIALGVASWANNLLVLLNTYFLLYFYTDVVGISGGTAGIIMLIARVWDAVNDPMMGIIVDKTRSKEGKCRFWLKYFSVPTAVVLFLSYFCPAVSTPGKIAWVAVTYILQGMASTVLSVSTNALTARVTDDPDERVLIQQISSLGDLALSLTIPSVTLPLATFFAGESHNMITGFAGVVAIYSVIYGVLRLISWKGTEGYDVDSSEDEKHIRENHSGQSILELIRQTFRNHYALLASASYIFYLLISAIMGSTTVYYFKYNLQNTNLLSVYSVAVMVGSVIGILTMKPMHKLLGNARSCAFCGAACVVGCIIRWVTMDQNFLIFVVSMIILGFGSGMVGSYSVQCILDSCTYAKLKDGANNQGTTMAVFTFSQKLGQALGGVVAGWMLELVPYVANAQIQEQSVLDLFFAENIILPMILAGCLTIGFLLVSRYEKRLRELVRNRKAEEQGIRSCQKV